MNKNEYNCTKRNLEIQMIDTTSKTNSKGRLLGFIFSKDNKKVGIMRNVIKYFINLCTKLMTKNEFKHY